MPFKDKTFDIAICSEVIEHTQNPGVLLENISNILKPEGKLIISIPNEKLINALKKIYFFISIFRQNTLHKDTKYRIAKKWMMNGICMNFK